MPAIEHRGPRSSRRRFIAIAGAVAGAALLPPSAHARTAVHDWNGVALGARASIRLLHPDAAEARRIIALAVDEIERLERIFSLYRADSALARLNREGRLEPPPLELVELLQRAAAVSEASGGAFDVTVQPLWRGYQEHFAAGGETAPDLAALLPLVGWRRLQVDAERVAFGRPGMAVTLNGIAQGFVTDRVAELLRRNGVERVLLDLGEIRGLGSRPDGRGWQVGIADPAEPTHALGALDCSGRAVATSGGYGTVFDREARFSHLIDPRRGTTAPTRRGVTVVAAEATLADAWSTAFSLMPAAEIRDRAQAAGGLGVYLAVPGALRRLV
ncbi:thiamine biosynthesis lipoprotein [Tistlia consotensis]|uniref:FAD:protein FMN transferase n=1 Tax=Tistlia consotensis USBA 355 TaxID=560819 RepID=A0A1Y6BUY5_9PROT|nr:FAD:protein FMN transferase [Tistlia consotensis]SMF21574.1 thiamine biosynthesis lipoprotein [Tistlia consotensis USBA 355]SNR46786.1 thiamine biosynthesis lipoprotein [Tistlia consotensis]